MIDLREATELFGVGPQIVCDQVLPEEESVVLQADEFESLKDATEVHDAAERILVAVNAVLYLDDPARKELSIASIHQRGPNGGWSIAIFPKSASYRFRGAKARGQAGSLGDSPSPTPQSTWLQTGLNEEAVSDALSYLRGTPDWIALYKVYEVINRDVVALKSTKGVVPGWPSQTQINSFKRSAQLHRHSKSHCEKTGIASAGAMTFDAASALVRSTMKTWLEWRSA